jgi:hypothetical protein
VDAVLLDIEQRLLAVEITPSARTVTHHRGQRAGIVIAPELSAQIDAR